MLNYTWVCHFCKKTNPPNATRCAFCGKDAMASSVDIELAIPKDTSIDRGATKAIHSPRTNSVASTYLALVILFVGNGLASYPIALLSLNYTVMKIMGVAFAAMLGVSLSLLALDNKKTAFVAGLLTIPVEILAVVLFAAAK